MNFRQLRYLCTVAEQRSISKAAKELLISQPSLSNFIAKTEDMLGVRLFERSTSAPLILTFAGERFIEHARTILMQANSMMREMSDISGNIAGRITLGFPHERLSYMLPIILPIYKELYPNIELKFATGNGEALLSLLRAGQIDLVVLPYQEADPQLQAVDLFDETLYVVAGRGVLDTALTEVEGEPSLNLQELARQNFVLLREGHMMRRFVDDFFRSLGISLQIILETSSNLASYKIASSGLGVTIVPQTTLNLAREEPISVKIPFAQWSVRVLFRRSAYIGEPERRLIGLLKTAY